MTRSAREMRRADLQRLEVREYEDRDEAQCLALRNEVFPPISIDDWRQGTTAAVALIAGEVVGVIPFAVRPFQLRPGLEARGAFANSVAVAEDLRGAGIGGAMMHAAAEFLPGQADSMFVYTADELAGRPYRFYRRTGHADLAYPAIHRLVSCGRATTAGAASYESVDPTRVGALEPGLLTAFQERWSSHGGYRTHGPGYYSRALSSHIFSELPVDEFGVVHADATDGSFAYALVAVREGEISILEEASSPGQAAGSVAEYLGAMGDQRGATVTVWSCRTPYAGFAGGRWVRQPRDDVLVGRCLRPDVLWGAAADPTRPGLRVEVWTPDGTVGFGPEGPVLQLEMKREELDQLLLCRRSLVSDVDLQRVTVASGTRELVERASHALQPAQWECHRLDYI